VSDTETMWLVIAGVLGLAVILFVVYLIGSTARSRPKGGGKHRAPRKNRPHRDTFRTEEPEPEPLKRAAIIIEGADDVLRRELAAQNTAAGWDQPLWLEVLDDLGARNAGTEAQRENVDVVCVRGDSRIRRAVAAVFAGTETPVSFLPSTQDESDPLAPAIAAAMTTALTGQNTRIDIGRAVLGPADPAAVDGPDAAADTADVPSLVFLDRLVIGEVVASDEPALSTKEVAREIVKANPFTATVKPDDEEAIVRPARSISFATSDRPLVDGDAERRVLDGYLYASRSLKGWAGVAKAMMRKASRATPLLVPMRSVAFTVTLDKPAPVTVDGELFDIPWPAGEGSVAVEPRALVIRR